MAKYPDISHWHPVKDWGKVKKNCPFLISKATQGTSFVDSTLDSFINGCEKNGIPYWLYTLLDSGREVDQVKFMVETCKTKIGKYFVGYILDVEAGNKAAHIQDALDYLTSLGGKTMLYTMYAQYSTYKNVIANRPSECAWWEARYGKNDGTYNQKYKCHNGVDLHQFTSNGSCDGISGRCDLNQILQKGESWFTTPVGVPKQTVGKTAEKVIEQARSWLGKNEADGSHKEIIDLYNSHKPLARGYTVKYNDSWCATFVSAVAIKLGYTDIIPTECSCERMIDAFKLIGCWIENENRTPKPGDIIFYDWQDSGSGDNTGWSDHVGIVEAVSSGQITVIEGNYDDSVKRRKIAVNARYIRGYGVPKYDAGSVESKSVEEIAQEVIAGKWGSGTERKKKLTQAGYDYQEVQDRVNALLKGQKSVTEIAKEVIAGKWGNNPTRKKKLEAAGYDYEAVRKEVNRLM